MRTRECARKTLVVDADMDVSTARILAERAGVHHIVVGAPPDGITCQCQLRGAWPDQTVGSVAQPARRVAAEVSAEECLELLRGVTALVVVGAGGQAIGVVSRRELAHAGVATESEFERCAACDARSSLVVMEGGCVAYCSDCLSDRHVRSGYRSSDTQPVQQVSREARAAGAHGSPEEHRVK